MNPTNLRPRFRSAVAAAALAAAAVAVGSSTAAAAPSVPSDPSAKGFIGLCDKNNHNVTGGTIRQAPFVWKAVASVPPPKAYLGRGQNAVLNIYQPRPGVLAGDWSGDQLTAATFYSTSRAPSTQATLKDIALKVIIKEFPPLVDGIYELRMYFGKANYGLYSATYPATYIRVEGNTWSVVKGGSVNCAAASGQSQEVLTGYLSPKQAYGPTGPQSAHGRPSSAPTHAANPAAASTTPPRGSRVSGSQSPVGNEAPAGNAVQPTAGSASKSSSAIAWWVAALAGAVAATLGVAFWRTRRGQTQPARTGSEHRPNMEDPRR